MSMTNAAQAAANWSKGMAGSGDKLKAGINAVTESPTAKAAAAVDRMVAGIVAAAASGKIAAGLNAVSLADWKNAMLNKGLQRIAAGAQAATPKVQNFMAQWLPFIQSTVAGLPPRGDLETNISRMNSVVRAAAGFTYRKAG